MQNKHQWDMESSSKEIQFEGNAAKNSDGSFRIAITKDNVLQNNTIDLETLITKAKGNVGNAFEVMVGICDKKVRKERGMLFQDKSFAGHGMYLLYSTNTNSFVFSHWDFDINYNEGGFIFFGKGVLSLTVQDSFLIVKQKEKSLKLKIEHNRLSDLYFCAVISLGNVQIL